MLAPAQSSRPALAAREAPRMARAALTPALPAAAPHVASLQVEERRRSTTRGRRARRAPKVTSRRAVLCRSGRPAWHQSIPAAFAPHSAPNGTRRQRNAGRGRCEAGARAGVGHRAAGHSASSQLLELGASANMRRHCLEQDPVAPGRRSSSCTEMRALLAASRLSRVRAAAARGIPVDAVHHFFE